MVLVVLHFEVWVLLLVLYMCVFGYFWFDFDLTPCGWCSSGAVVCIVRFVGCGLVRVGLCGFGLLWVWFVLNYFQLLPGRMRFGFVCFGICVGFYGLMVCGVCDFVGFC